MAHRGACSPCVILGTTVHHVQQEGFLVMDLCVSSDMIHHKLSHINLFFEAIKKARLFDRAAQSNLGLASSRRFDFHIELPL
jgi:hypothetical protein